MCARWRRSESDDDGDRLQMTAEQTMARTRTSDDEVAAFAKAGVGKGGRWRGVKLKR